MSWASRTTTGRRGFRVLAAVALIGIGAGACSPSPSVTTSVAAVDFGPVATGTSAPTKVVDVTVTNFLPAARELLRAVVIPYEGNPFTVEGFDCPESEDVVVPGQLLATLTCHLTVGYAPTADGNFTGDVRVLMLFFPAARVSVAGSTSPTPVLPETPVAIALPLVGLAALGGGFLLTRRRL